MTRGARASTGAASSGPDGGRGADNALVLAEIALQVVLQASHADPQQPGRLAPVPAGLFECFEDVELLDLAQGEPPRHRRERRRRRVTDDGGKMLDVKDGLLAEHDGTLRPLLDLLH